MRKKTVYETARIQRVIETLIANSMDNFNLEEILAGHKEYQENRERYKMALGRLNTTGAGKDMLFELEDSSAIIKDIQKETAYIQGLKDGLAILQFAAGSSEEITVFSENYTFKGTEGRKLYVK